METFAILPAHTAQEKNPRPPKRTNVEKPQEKEEKTPTADIKSVFLVVHRFEFKPIWRRNTLSATSKPSYLVNNRTTPLYTEPNEAI